MPEDSYLSRGTPAEQHVLCGTACLGRGGGGGGAGREGVHLRTDRSAASKRPFLVLLAITHCWRQTAKIGEMVPTGPAASGKAARPPWKLPSEASTALLSPSWPESVRTSIPPGFSTLQCGA